MYVANTAREECENKCTTVGALIMRPFLILRQNATFQTVDFQ